MRTDFLFLFRILKSIINTAVLGIDLSSKKLTAIIYEVETDRAYMKASSSKGISDSF